MLSPSLQADILALYFGKKLSFRKIARELGVHRKTVATVVERRKVETERPTGLRKSILDPFKPRIEGLLRTDPTIASTVVLQKIRSEGYLGGISGLRAMVAAMRVDPTPKEAFLTLSFEPGECAQVDWGEFGDVFCDGTKIHAFVMVLCYSRKLYLEFTRRERFEDFIRCHENAFRYFGGVPTECWYDNLASSVSERLGALTRFNARFMAYMGHHGIKPYACNQSRGNEKGRVEDGVKFIRSSFWPGRHFKNFLDLCSQGTEWQEVFANKREHSTTRRIPELVFHVVEKEKLLTPNPIPYDTDYVFSRPVPPNFHITYDTNQYSVPWTLTGLPVTVRINDKYIKIFYHDRLVTQHDRCYLPHQPHFTKDEHKAGLLESKPLAKNNAWQIDAIKSLGEPLEKYLEFLQAGRRSLRTESSKILALSTIYGQESLVKAVGELLKLGIVGVDNLEMKLKSGAEVTNPPPIHFKKEELNRVHSSVDLRLYDALYFKSQNDPDNIDGGNHE
jgi:transposase